MGRKCGALNTQKYVNQFSMIFAEELQVYRVLLGEMGRYTLASHFFQRRIKYWLKVIQMLTARYPHVCYRMIYRLHNNCRHTLATYIALLLTKIGLQHVWAQQGVGNEDVFFEVLCLRLKNDFKSNWEDGIKNSSTLAIYSQFKCYLIPESYLEIINIRKYLFAFSKFICSNHQLAIEQGRHSETLMADRICVLCNARNCVVVEDEYHFFLICDDYKLLRHRYVNKHLPPYDETQSGF